MENVTKALLIAAGVLVALMLISVAIWIISSNSDLNNVDSTLSEMERIKFNLKYEQYQGIQSGKNVKLILNYAIDDNEYLDDRDSTKGLNIRSNHEDFKKLNQSWGGALDTRSYGLVYSSNIKKMRDTVKPHSKYKVWYNYTNNGLIHEIHIDKPD